MILFDAILQNGETEREALEWARGFAWCDCETSEQPQPTHSKHIQTVDGVGVYYDYGMDYYFFTDEDFT